MKFLNFLNSTNSKNILKSIDKINLIDEDKNTHFNEYFQIYRNDLYDELETGLGKLQKYYKKQNKKVKHYEKVCLAIVEDGYFYLPKRYATTGDLPKNDFHDLYFDKNNKNFTEIYDLTSQYFSHIYAGEYFSKALTDVLPIRIKTKRIKRLKQYKEFEDTLVFICCKKYRNDIVIPPDHVKIPIWYDKELCNYNDNSLTVNIIIEILQTSITIERFNHCKRVF